MHLEPLYGIRYLTGYEARTHASLCVYTTPTQKGRIRDIFLLRALRVYTCVHVYTYTRSTNRRDEIRLLFLPLLTHSLRRCCTRRAVCSSNLDQSRAGCIAADKVARHYIEKEGYALTPVLRQLSVQILVGLVVVHFEPMEGRPKGVFRALHLRRNLLGERARVPVEPQHWTVTAA
jgi:hypothetical protein